MCREWGIAPQDIWAMTISEIAYEYEWRRPNAPTDYAGGMTEGDIEEMQDAGQKLREKIRKARENGTETP